MLLVLGKSELSYIKSDFQWGFTLFKDTSTQWKVLNTVPQIMWKQPASAGVLITSPPMAAGNRKNTACLGTHRYIHALNSRIFYHAPVSILYLTRNSESCYVFKFTVGHGLAKVFNISNSQKKQFKAKIYSKSLWSACKAASYCNNWNYNTVNFTEV